jgi:diguanylate cyclase (GGDEF)-like protein
VPKKVKRTRSHPQGRPQGRKQARRKAAPASAVLRRRKAGVKAVAKPAPVSARLRKLQAELRAARARIAELERHADTDFLVNTLNRRGFERELRRAMAYAKRYGANAALVYLDVNGLKPVNDRYGHLTGDAVLRAVARTLADNVRMSDMVARLGGDEFAVLLWNLSEREAAIKTAGLEQAVAQTSIVAGADTVAISAAAGFTMLRPADDPQQILDRADQAMYARKRAIITQ